MKEMLKQRTKKIITKLKKLYPDSQCSLYYNDPFQLLIATQLSAQCTDERVNKVTPALFDKYQTVEDFAKADLQTLQSLIHSTGFYKNKARNIQNCARQILEKYHGQVPNQLEDLIMLDGVGRKTANVVLGNAFGMPGLVVDTHVTRLTNRLKLTHQKDTVKIEFAMMEIIPKKDWSVFAHLMINHGRKICKARTPLCKDCGISQWCPSKNI